jgi:two-component system sensor histidine kinase KdpD
LEPHSIREAIDAAIRSSQQVLQHHPLDIKVPENLPLIKMDLERITEVLVHLLENASKYSPPDTPIHVVAELRAGGEIVTSIADHGPGIDDIEQDMVFEKFYRGRNQRMTIQGTGMGLAIAKAIVELHGGTIAVRSQVGRGSVFYFTLHAN